MKTNYFLNVLFAIAFFSLATQTTDAQIRMIEVDPATNTVKIRNYGGTTEDLTSYWFCHLFTYSQLGSGSVQSGSLNLAPGEEVVVTSSTSFSNAASDLGLYQTSSFGSSTSMQDFVQWGTGGQGRESVAVTKGIWTAGTFVSAPPPYEYTGSGAQNGFQFWDTLLGINDFNNGLGLKLYPNPVEDFISIKLTNGGTSIDFQVYDILGKQVTKGTSSLENEVTINVSTLENGLYILNITSGNQNEVKRFIKQ